MHTRTNIIEITIFNAVMIPTSYSYWDIITYFTCKYNRFLLRFPGFPFAELLLRANELWLNKPHILQHYRERFTNILVDEFQDTNNIQYAWIRLRCV